MLNFAIETARDAGQLLLEKFDRNIKVSKKGDIDLVTEADLASEALIIERIKSYYPKHSILAEESGNAVIIGGENEWDEMKDVSLVVARYGQEGKIGGLLGVIGPTRLNYARVIPMVDYAARIVSQLIGK